MPRAKLTVPLLAFLLALGLFGALNRGDATRAAVAPEQAGVLPPGASTEEQVVALQAAVRTAAPADRPYTPLGLAYLQRARETADVAFYARAEDALRRAGRADARDADAVVGLATLALARHDFREALGHARRARALQPDAVAPFPVLVDALVELGRYDEAGRALQQLVDRKPSLPAYARVSYFRELHGDRGSAAEALRLAVSAAGAPEAVAYVQGLLGDLERQRGRRRAAAVAYRAALVSVPGHGPSELGAAKLDLASGREARGLRRLRALVERLPLPPHAIALAEAELAAGNRARGRDALELVRVQQQLLNTAGVDTDVELAIFEADHGSAARAVALARRGWASAPSVRSAEALGWALARAGRPNEGLRFARRSLALGWQDPLVLAHAGLVAKAAGERAEARRLLRRALAGEPDFHPLLAPRARRALEDLR